MSAVPNSQSSTKSRDAEEVLVLQDAPALVVELLANHHPRAEVKKIDVERARRVPGVKTILTGDSFQGGGKGAPLPSVSGGELTFEGQPVLAVVAENRESAMAGLEAVEVTLAPLPPILDLDEAAEMKSFHADPVQLTKGDAEGRFENPDGLMVESGRCEITKRPERSEMQCLRAELSAGDGVIVEAPTLNAGTLQAVVAGRLGLPLSKVCVVPSGAASASNSCVEMVESAWAAIVAAAALETGRRVELVCPAGHEDRDRAPVAFADYEVLFSAEDGRIAALSIEFLVDGGCYEQAGVEHALLKAVPAVYRVKDLSVTVRHCLTHRDPARSFAAIDIASAFYVVEEVVAIVAGISGVLPEVVRQRNFMGELNDGNELVRLWRGALRAADYAKLRKSCDFANSGNRFSKRGLAAIVARVPSFDRGSRGGDLHVSLQMFGDGSLTALVPACDAVARRELVARAAEATGASLGAIRLLNADNSDAVWDPDSRLALFAAFDDALAGLLAQLRPIAVDVFVQSGFPEIDADSVDFMEGRVFSRANPDIGFSFEEFAVYYHSLGLLPAALGTASIGSVGGGNAPSSLGVAACEARLDCFAGRVEVLRASLYLGDGIQASVRPLFVRSLKVGFLDGMGWLCRPDGERTPIQDSPLEFEVNFVSDVKEVPRTIEDARSLGAALSLSVREAVRNAMGDARKGEGIVNLPCPMLPEALFREIHRKR